MADNNEYMEDEYYESADDTEVEKVDAVEEEGTFVELKYDKVSFGDLDFDDDEDDVLDDFDNEDELYYDDVFKEEEDIDEPYDDVEPEDGYYTSRHKNDDEDDISFIDKYDL